MTDRVRGEMEPSFALGGTADTGAATRLSDGQQPWPDFARFRCCLASRVDLLLAPRPVVRIA